MRFSTLEGANATLTPNDRCTDPLTSTYSLTLDALPGRVWVYPYHEMRRELLMLSGLSGPQVRDLLFDAYAEATTADLINQQGTQCQRLSLRRRAGIKRRPVAW